jgi:hypothetical protein
MVAARRHANRHYSVAAASADIGADGGLRVAGQATTRPDDDDSADSAGCLRLRGDRRWRRDHRARDMGPRAGWSPQRPLTQLRHGSAADRSGGARPGPRVAIAGSGRSDRGGTWSAQSVDRGVGSGPCRPCRQPAIKARDPAPSVNVSAVRWHGLGTDAGRWLGCERDQRFGWCCWRGLNSRPPPYQGGALPLSYSSAGTARGRGIDRGWRTVQGAGANARHHGLHGHAPSRYANANADAAISGVRCADSR